MSKENTNIDPFRHLKIKAQRKQFCPLDRKEIMIDFQMSFNKKRLEKLGERELMMAAKFMDECIHELLARTEDIKNAYHDMVQVKKESPETEIWKDVVGYEGKYKVSSIGRVMSLPNRSRKTVKLLKLILNDKGYTYVVLKAGKNSRVHRLVAEAFISNPDNKPFVNHINGVRNDNRVENLEWCTQSENFLHGFKMGFKSMKGESHSQNKLTEIQVREIFKDERDLSEIAENFGISKAHVRNIKMRKTWSHLDM